MLILASIDKKIKQLPPGWQVDKFNFSYQMLKPIRQVFSDIEPWHHRTNDALPVTLGSYFGSPSFIYPKNEEELLYYFAIEASLSLGNWQLVKYVVEE